MRSLLCLLIICILFLQGCSRKDLADEGFQIQDRLDSVAQAMVRYKSLHGHYPPAWVADSSGGRFHSWRILILPYLEANTIYNQYSLDVPWNAQSNLQIIQKEPSGPKEHAFEYYCGSSGRNTQIFLLLPDQERDPSVKTPGLSNRDWTGKSSLIDGKIVLLATEKTNVQWTNPTELELADIDQLEKEQSIRSALVIRPDGSFETIDRPNLLKLRDQLLK